MRKGGKLFLSPFYNLKGGDVNLIKNKTKNNWIITILLSLLICFSVPITNTTTAKADAEGNPELQQIVDSSLFITYRKGDLPDRGKYIMACYYVPKSVYNPNYVYGALIFPKDYSDRFGLTSDYMKKAQEQGVAIGGVENPTPIVQDDGYGFNCGIVNIRESNLPRTFAFIFFVRDSQGNYAYGTPNFAAYNTLDASELTMEEYIAITNSVVDMNSSFQGIVEKIEELTDAIWIYLLIAFGSIVIVWGSYIGIKIIIAKKNEEKINSRDMIKRLIIGIVVMSIIAVCCPLLISGLSHWIVW